MIWVRSCGKIHEFEADHFEAGTSRLWVLSDEGPARRGPSNVVAEFYTWDWVRHAEDGTQLLDDTELKNEELAA